MSVMRFMLARKACRQVKDRMREHQNDIIRGKQVSKVYNHINETERRFNFDNFSVLDSCRLVKVRLQLSYEYII